MVVVTTLFGLQGLMRKIPSKKYFWQVALSFRTEAMSIL
jgi:hypothetical protein